MVVPAAVPIAVAAVVSLIFTATVTAQGGEPGAAGVR